MIVLPELFYLNGIEHRPESICIVAGGENGNYIVTIIKIKLLIIKCYI